MCWPARDDAVRRADARGPPRPRRGGPDDRRLRAGDDDRPAGPGRGRRRGVRPDRRRRRAGRSTTRGSATPARSTSSTAPAGASPSTGSSTPGAASSPRGTGRRTIARPLGRARRARRALGAGRDGGRVDRRRRRRHARHDRAVPDAPQPQPGDDPRGDRGRAGRRARRVDASSGCRTGSALDDDTDGHVDNVAAFARPGVLVVQGCDDAAEEDCLRCDVNIRCARGALDAAGEPIDVVVVPDAAVHRGARSSASPCRTSTTTSSTAP